MAKCDSLRLERLQRRFHRIMCGNDCTADCLPLLEDRRHAQAMAFLNKTMNTAHILHKHLPDMSSSGRFILPARRTTRRCNSYFLLACELYNASFKR